MGLIGKKLCPRNAMSVAIMELLSLLDAPEAEFLAMIQRHGGRRIVDDLFDHAAEVQTRDPEAAMRCVRLIDRIQALLDKPS
jgi:hypothetical protein